MKKYLLVFFIALFSACKSNNLLQRQPNEKPNIILIMADDLGYETLGIYGSQSYNTPHLDKLANNGMRFNHCYATPLCTPSRVQLMTGKYNFRNYIGFGLLDAKEKTFGHYMQDIGYKTCVAGKWQLFGSSYQQKLAGGKMGTTPEKSGFNDYCLWQIKEHGSRYKDPKLSIKGKKTKVYKNRFGPDIFVDYIETFMEENKNDPFFVYYPMALTHDPFVPTPDHPEFEMFDAKSKLNNPVFFKDMVSYMDKLIGRIIEKTETLGIRENTLILFIGDNGTDRKVTSTINNVTLKGDKGHTTNAGTHVPFIANWNGQIKKGRINNNLIDFTDFLPSLMEIAAKKQLSKAQTDGLSFYPQLKGDNTNIRDWVYCSYNPKWGTFKPRDYVQDKKWKLYRNGNFYNLLLDPLEKTALDINTQSDSIKSKIKTFKRVLNTYQKKDAL